MNVTVLNLTLQIFISSLLNIMEAGPNIVTHCDTGVSHYHSVSPQIYSLSEDPLPVMLEL